jgi:hypothetical protein
MKMRKHRKTCIEMCLKASLNPLGMENAWKALGRCLRRRNNILSITAFRPSLHP